MRAGRLRHRLVLQSKSYTRDAYGAAVVNFTTETTVWGAIEPLSGREFFAQAQTQSEIKVRIVIRYNGSVDTSWRVKHGSTYYDIEEVINTDTRNRECVLMCRSGVTEDVGSEVYTVLLENGDNLLIETGDNLLLEA